MNVVTDVAYAFRKFRKSGIFTATAVLTLALGIGGTTAIFTLIHAVMLKSLPVGIRRSSIASVTAMPAACRVGRRTAGAWSRSRCSSASAPQCRSSSHSPHSRRHRAAWRCGAKAFKRRRARCARCMSAATISRRSASALSPGASSRPLTTPPAAPPVVMMAYHAWSGAFRGDAAIVGSTLIIEGHPFTVAGVAPAGLLRRNTPRRSTGSLDTSATRAAHHRRRNITPASTDLRLAASDRPAA